MRILVVVAMTAALASGQGWSGQGTSIRADMRGGDTVNASGSLRMTIGADRRVRNITVDGRAAGGRFNLNYRE
jgi:hypothetical protein